MRGDLPDQHGGRGAGDAGHVVMLGQPKPIVAPILGMAGKIHGIGKRLRDRAALGHRRQIENGIGKRHGNVLSRSIWGRIPAFASAAPARGRQLALRHPASYRFPH